MSKIFYSIFSKLNKVVAPIKKMKLIESQDQDHRRVSFIWYLRGCLALQHLCLAVKVEGMFHAVRSCLHTWLKQYLAETVVSWDERNSSWTTIALLSFKILSLFYPLLFPDNEKLPPMLLDLLDESNIDIYHSGCVIAEVRDYRRTLDNSYDTRYVLLQPTNQVGIHLVNQLSEFIYNLITMFSFILIIKEVFAFFCVVF